MDPPQFESLNRGRNQGQVPPSNRQQAIMDPRTFQTRNDIYTKNANLFIANNANPFLISPYAPPANLISKQLIEQLSALISTLSYSLASVINLNTYTLSISTIQPVPSDIPAQQIRIIASTLLIQGAPGATMQVQNSSFFNYVSSNYANVSSMNVGFLGYSTLTGSTITTNTLFANTFVSTPAISTTTISANTLFANTSISTNAIVASTLYADTYVSTPIISTATISTNTLAFVGPTPYHFVGTTGGPGAPLGAVQGVLNINVGGTAFRVPYYT